MTHDPDAAPERAETAAEPAAMPAAEQRAIDAAVAGVAGLLVGRALFGRAGGLVAGLAAVGAGLLAKRRPEAKKAAPDAAPLNVAAAAPESVAAVVPMTQVRLETGVGTVDDGWAVLADAGLPGMSGFKPLTVAAEKPEPESDVEPDDAGAFAEMPALFGSDLPRAITAPVPAADLAPWKELPETPRVEEPVKFDEGPAPVEVNALPVAELVSRAEEALEKDVFPEPAPAAPKAQTAPVPLMAFPGLLDDLPAEFLARTEEQEPGPREDFLMVPDQPAVVSEAISVPPIHSVVAALSESLEPPAAPSVVEAAEPQSLAEPEIASKEETIALPGVSEEKSPAVETPFPVIALPEIPVLAGVPVSLVPPAAAEPEKLVASPFSLESSEKSGPVISSPFSLWPTPPQPSTAPVPTPVSGEAAVPAALPFPVPPLPFSLAVVPAVAGETSASPEKPAGSVPAADPEEIWRQAAAELTALRNAPAPVLLPGPLPAVQGEPVAAPAFPPLPSSTAVPILPATAAPVAPASPPLPPWMIPQTGVEPVPPQPPERPDPSLSAARKTFLPTIKLGAPPGPQPGIAQRPIPVPPEAPRAPEPVAVVAPIVLPGYKAEPVPPILPVADSADALADIDAPMPAVPPLPQTAGPVSPGPFPTRTPPPAFAAAAGGAAPSAGEDKIFVPRAASKRHAPAPYKRRSITPLRIVVLAIAAAAALGLAYKPELKELWDQKILGKPSGKSRSITAPKPPVPNGVPGDASDVSIAPEPPPAAPKRPLQEKPAPAPAVQPDVPAVPPSEPPPAETKPVPTSTSPVADPFPVSAAPSAPPPADPESTGPLPVSEAGARELISRLIHATTPESVKPYILDVNRLEPTLEPYFSSGKALPVASHESHLERTDKSAATGRTVWLFRVTTDTVLRGFPVGVEDTADGLRTDWELFTQCRDGALQRFADDTSAPPGVYYAALKRAHMFPDMLPGSDPAKFFAFAVSSPALGDLTVNAFIPKGSQLATRVDNLFKFNTSYAPVLELAHKDGHVEITGITRENWRMASRSESR